MYTLKVERLIKNVSPDIVWDVISDVERYAEYAPNLSRAHKTSDGLTPARRCYDTQGRGWNEACVLWREGEVYSYLIDTTDYPYPFALMKGTWGLRPDTAGVVVYMQFDYIPRYPWPFGWLFHRLVRQKFSPIVERLMDYWEAEMPARARQRLATSAPPAPDQRQQHEQAAYK